MRKYLIPENGNFYKANLHCHTTFSDGKKTPAEVKELYRSLGYSVVAYTDHDILIAHDELNDENFLALHGFEMEINEPGSPIKRTCHLCFIGIDPENMTQPLWHRTKYLFGNAPTHREEVVFDDTLPDYVRSYTHEGVNEVIATAQKKGFFVTYNHPTWSREDFSHYSGYVGMNAFEIMNGSCLASGYEDYNPRVYDDMLRMGKKLYCIGADDNHNGHPDGSRRSDSGLGFTVIKADKLDYRTITQALLDGSFYASEGPEIYELYYEDGKVYVRSSDADTITCNYNTRRAGIKVNDSDEPVTSAEFAVPEDCGYFRITVTDKKGKHACTNAYFVSDLIGE